MPDSIWRRRGAPFGPVHQDWEMRWMEGSLTKPVEASALAGEIAGVVGPRRRARARQGML
jgi:hypothetical protein